MTSDPPPSPPLPPRQRTLAAPAEIAGVGLFTAARVEVRILPAGPGAGLVFERTDTPTRARMCATVDRVAPAEHRTALHDGAVRLETVEHCLAALVGMGVDNATIEVNGPELPIGDGSCAIFADAIAGAGIVDQEAPRRTLVVREAVRVTDDRSGAVLEAHPIDEGATPVYSYELDYGGAAPIRAHGARVALTPGSFAEELVFARTFSTMQEAAAARAMGMFTHLEPRDMLVIGPEGPIDNVLRCDDEPARHKVIDMIGDLSLVGAVPVGRFVGTRSGHTLNHALARKLLEQA